MFQVTDLSSAVVSLFDTIFRDQSVKIRVILCSNWYKFVSNVRGVGYIYGKFMLVDRP